LVEEHMDTAGTDDHLVDAVVWMAGPPDRVEDRPVRGGQGWDRQASVIVVRLMCGQSVPLVPIRG
jgi:hypothetical protein